MGDISREQSADERGAASNAARASKHAESNREHLRILLATDHYPPFIGGAQLQTYWLAKSLVKRGHDVSVATVWQRSLPSHETNDGIAVHRLRQVRTCIPWVAHRTAQHHQPPFPDPVTILALKRIIARARPDIVHSIGWFSYSSAAALLGTSTAHVITACDYGYGCAKQTLLIDDRVCSGPKLRKCLGCAGAHYGRPKGWAATAGVLGSAPLLRRRLDGIHSVSTYVRDIVRRDFVDDRLVGRRARAIAHKVYLDIIPSTDDTAPASSVDDDLAVYLDQLPREPFILFVGALRRVKGIEQLLEAYARLASPPPLVMIGTIESDTPPISTKGVVTLHDLPHAAVMAAWRRCLFGVLPSLWPEPFGTVVSEVLSCGKAVIVTTPGGQADVVVDGVTGLLVPAGDSLSLAAAMESLIASDDLRERLGHAGRERVRDLTADRKAEHLEAFYRERVAGRQRGKLDSRL